MSTTMAHSDNGVVFRCRGTEIEREECKRVCVQYYDGVFQYCKQLRTME